jgi:hypothetical protein
VLCYVTTGCCGSPPLSIVSMRILDSDNGFDIDGTVHFEHVGLRMTFDLPYGLYKKGQRSMRNGNAMFKVK